MYGMYTTCHSSVPARAVLCIALRFRRMRMKCVRVCDDNNIIAVSV